MRVGVLMVCLVRSVVFEFYCVWVLGMVFKCGWVRGKLMSVVVSIVSFVGV